MTALRTFSRWRHSGAGIIGAVPRHFDCVRVVGDGTGRRRRDGREATAAATVAAAAAATAAASGRAGDVVLGVKRCRPSSTAVSFPRLPATYKLREASSWLKKMLQTFDSKLETVIQTPANLETLTTVPSSYKFSARSTNYAGHQIGAK
ncbi:hypothetical protein B0H13DRAFT_1872791 [Mycena leptocephala]|nr:hypothetical protein B0H13DRAFT_1872791 [Mycena leptocephala]